MITVVVVEHDHDRQLMFLANSQRGKSGIVIERAIADQAKHGPLGKSRLDPEGGAGSGAESADATGKKRSWLQHVEITMNGKSVRDCFFDDHRIGWQDLSKLIGDPTRIDRLLVFTDQRFFFPFGLSFFVA